jgi:hypothetical protein
MKSTVMFLINANLDCDIRRHVPWAYEDVDAEDYNAVIQMWDTASTRIRIGDNLQYTWDSLTWAGRDVDCLAAILNRLNEEDFKLCVLTEGHIYQQGVLVL